MKHPRTLRHALAHVAATTLALLLATATPAPAQTTTRVSTSPVNTQGNFHSFFGSVSDDGRFVVFQSGASNLVLSDTNFHLPDIFRKDRTTSNTTLVSVDSASVQGNSGSMAPSLSADGRWTAFESFASNLVMGDTNGVWDVFVHDELTGATVRASVGLAGAEGNADSRTTAISADGRFVAFESAATNLVAGDTNGMTDVFLHDLSTGTTTLVSGAAGGTPGNGASYRPTISANGRFVAFASAATNLGPADLNAADDVYLEDTLTGAVALVSVDSAGVQGNLASVNPSLSPDGRYVAFQSDASNLVPTDSNAASDVFVHDRATGSTMRVSVSSTGLQANGQSLLQGNRHVAVEGRFIAFDSTASNLVAGDTNGASDCFVHDLLRGTTERISLNSSGVQANSNASAPSISPDGRFVVFESSATNLVAGDNNLMWDVFLRDRGANPSVPYCFGDGTGTPCPCANNGAPGSGCAHSLNPSGARLTGSGTPSLAADTFLLQGTGMPDSSALYFQGTTAINGGSGSAFGDGLRCAGGVVIRLGTQLNIAGESHYPDTGDALVSIRGAITAGDSRTYQVWYRNAASFCTVDTFNLTNGLSVSWIP